jgi:hypothetical protein
LLRISLVSRELLLTSGLPCREATSTDRFGYVDGAFDTGRREAERIGAWADGRLPPFTEGSIGMRPGNDAALREAWYETVKQYVL